jgi:hypothetical protein
VAAQAAVAWLALTVTVAGFRVVRRRVAQRVHACRARISSACGACVALLLR